MAFIAKHHPGFVLVLDTSMQRKYYLTPGAWNALDQTSLGAQARLAGAAEYSIDGRGELMKMPGTVEQMLTDYLTLRSGGPAAKFAIPAAVRDAVVALNGAIAAAS